MRGEVGLQVLVALFDLGLGLGLGVGVGVGVGLGVQSSLPAQESSQESSQGSKWKSERLDVQISMRDGKCLAGDVFLPAVKGRYPAVLIQTPYNKRLLRPQLRRRARARAGLATRGLLGFVDRQRYAYVVVDWRGFFGSKGALALGWRPANRGRDGYDTVEWIAGQQFSNGKVGTWGGSALGKQQFSTAIEQPPHLVCAAPLIAAMGQSYAGYYRGGVLLSSHVSTLDRLGFGLGKIVRQFPLGDEFIWSLARRRSYKPDRIQVPMLLVTGWWDHFPDLVLQTFDDLLAKGGEKTRRHSKIIIGPWDHMSIGKEKQGELRFPGATKTVNEVTRMFFDRWLREDEGEEEEEEGAHGWNDEPRFRYWQLGTNQWIKAKAWPDTKIDWQTWYLQADGGLRQGHRHQTSRTGRAQGEVEVRKYEHDPRQPCPTIGGANLPPLTHGPRDQSALLDRRDVLVYSTSVLEESLILAGAIEVKLWFSCNRVDCDLAVRLCDHYPDGRSILVGDGIQRARLRGGKPSPLVPGERYHLTVKLPPVSMALGKGHRLQLIVSSANHPRFELNPHTGADHFSADEALDLEVKLYHGGESGSRVRLPLRRM